MESFRVRLNCADHYQATPSHLDPQFHHGDSQPDTLPKVPVIRLFGATQTGQKVCAHIHGALPYIYIDYEGNLEPDEANAYIHRIHLAIDHALGVSYRRNASKGNINFVAQITLVKGTPFYGYHEGYKLYLKIYLFNPLHVTRLSDLLRQGAVMKRVFQPYESHLQYLLQWMCDYNLYGCDYLVCDKVMFRGPVPELDDLDSPDHLWHNQSISPRLISDEMAFPRLSHCSLEVDIRVQDIVNRREIKPRPIHHDFIERSNPISSDERLVHSMASLWKDETRRRKSMMQDPDPNSSPFPPEVLISMSAEPRSSQKGGWIHEDEYMQKVQEIIAQEEVGRRGRKTTFESFAKSASSTRALGSIKSTLESVEDLYPENIQTRLTPKSDSALARSMSSLNGDTSRDVDESRIFHDEENGSLLGSDEDTLMEPAVDGVAKKEGSEQPAKKEAQGSRSVIGDESFDSNKTEVVPVVEAHLLPPGGPDASNEMAQYGIHEANNLLQATRGKFDIPLEYTNGTGMRSFSLEKHMIGRSSSQRPHKRQKLSHEHANGFSETESLDAAKAVRPLESKYQGQEATPKALAPGSQAQQSRSARATDSRRSSLQASQESIKSSADSGNKSLSFQVVKDPRGPASFRKPDQRKPSSQNSATPVPSKAVSFDTVRDARDQYSISHVTSSGDSAEISRLSSSVVKDLAAHLQEGFGSATIQCRSFILKAAPPSAASIVSEMQSSNSMPLLYQEAYYSDEKDVPSRTREYAGRGFRLASTTVPYLPDFDPTGGSDATTGAANLPAFESAVKGIRARQRNCTLRSWEFFQTPPSRTEVELWCLQQRKQQEAKQASESQASRAKVTITSGLSQIDGPTQKNRHGFKYSQKRKSSAGTQEAQYMSMMSCEVHVNTRNELLPNPEEDEIACVFWCYQADNEIWSSERVGTSGEVGILVLSEQSGLAQTIAREVPVYVKEEPTELDLINKMVDVVRLCDPDVLTGYEVHDGSWGYLIERARCKYDYNLCDEFSRMKSQSHGRFGKDNDRWGFNHTSTIRVTGRHMINVWRAMRGELNLLQYSLENVAFHLLHKRIPHYSHKDLTAWYKSGRSRDLAKVLDYYINRVQIDLEILEKNELIPRTSEQARILGVDFFSVFSRGSQYKVESLMFRIAKAENYVLVSPSRKQVGQQNALECLPLVMEPQSDFYTSPVLVLDFQSLYPSIMIAYNYCYSTFLGRIVNWRGQNKMGFTDYQRDPQLLELLQDHINIAPNGMMYVRPQVRKSLLAKMLSEILETRVMVKSGMKVNKNDKALQQLLNNRQLALKLIANVTYGYTSASFSGRMPCSEIADSIVQTARETLERAIALIHSVERWGAEVVYGDTDSLFVYLKGRSKDQAFEIGKEIAEAVTQTNPRPVKLKFEKVYLPSVLLAKKRYVGFKYENQAQKEPDFDAKGIETVRRDGTPAEQKIEETALKILFRTADLSQVKDYFQKQCTKIMQGKVSIQDFCFAREVKLGTYSDRGPMPPGALVSTRKMLEDPRAEPQYGERVPYVVIAGAPGARLIDRCVAPEVLLQNEYNKLDAEYYIGKNLIPPLERIFNLVGANVRGWYDEMPKFQRVRRIEAVDVSDAKDPFTRKTLESYMKSSLCVVCRDKVKGDIPLCDRCLVQPDVALYKLKRRVIKDDQKAAHLEKICRSCASLPWGETVRCDSKDCPVFYSRTRHMSILRSTKAGVRSVMEMLEEMGLDRYDW